MSFSKFINRNIFLAGIILVAVTLRFWNLGHTPGGFHIDEAAYGYNAFSIVTTGKDEFGKTLPLVLESFGEYKPALYAYLTIPSILIFGLNEMAVRLPTAIFGSLSVLIFYLLVRRLTRNENISLLSALLLAISPWHINLSRTTSEVVVSLFFILLLVYAALEIKEKFKLQWFSLALLSGFLAIGSYTASRLYVIIITGLILFMFIKFKNNIIGLNKRIILLCSALIVIGIIFSVLDSTSRFQQVSIFSSPETKLVLEEQIREDEFSNVLVTRAIHNKAINFSRTILKNYSEYLTFDFLFLSGGYPFRVRIPDSGLFYFWQIPFFIAGGYVLLRRKEKLLLFLFGWIGLLLIPTALTFDEIPNIYRSLIILPPALVILAIGIYEIFSYKLINRNLSKLLILAIFLIGLIELLFFQHQYYVHQEKHQPWYRGFAYKDLISTINDLSSDYDKIYFTKSHSGPHIYILFFNKYDPATYQKEGSPGDPDFGGFGKYTFFGQDCLPEEKKPNEKFLYINKGECVPGENAKLLKTIYWADKSPAFKVLEHIPEPAEEAKR